ncbi:hypothetical protein AC481_01575 [miscellaneous Crenarchaeota group archaeon SMTZ-80]|nr:MAG: hypothetical protein AC481_01575 [miscellaneous Crenarchaeota group archaeon SMTZ-80]
MRKQEIFTLSNWLSFARIFLVLPIYYYLSIDDKVFALILILIAIITDTLDGYFARKLGQITDLGKLLDPLADKICTAGGLIALSLYHGFPLWLTFVVIIRDVIIIIGSIFLISSKHIVVASNKPGKVTVFLVALLAISYIVNIAYLFKPLLVLVLLMLTYSVISYIIVFVKYMKNQNNV